MDQKLFFLINHDWSSPKLDLLMAMFSSLNFWLPILLVVIACGAVFGGFKTRAFLVTVLLTIALTDGVVVGLLKKAVNRPRPSQAEAVRVVSLATKAKHKKIRPQALGVFYPPVVKTSRPETGTIEGRSFPSGHTSNNFAIAAVLIAFYRRWGWLYLFMAAAVSYSRIYVGSHWPSDVFVSMFLGTGVGLLCAIAAEKIWRRWAKTVVPRLYRQHPSLGVWLVPGLKSSPEPGPGNHSNPLSS